MSMHGGDAGGAKEVARASSPWIILWRASTLRNMGKMPMPPLSPGESSGSLGGPAAKRVRPRGRRACVVEGHCGRGAGRGTGAFESGSKLPHSKRGRIAGCGGEKGDLTACPCRSTARGLTGWSGSGFRLLSGRCKAGGGGRKNDHHKDTKAGGDRGQDAPGTAGGTPAVQGRPGYQG